MWRREEEYIRDEARADYLDDKARYEAAMGNYGQAAIDEARSDLSRFEAVADLTNPYGPPPHHHGHHHHREGEYIAAEVAAVEIERDREIIERERLREMEFAAAGGPYGLPPCGANPYYPQAPGYTVTVTPNVPGAYPGTYVQTYPQQPPGYPGYPGGVPGYPPY